MSLRSLQYIGVQMLMDPIYRDNKELIALAEYLRDLTDEYGELEIQLQTCLNIIAVIKEPKYLARLDIIEQAIKMYIDEYGFD